MCADAAERKSRVIFALSFDCGSIFNGQNGAVHNHVCLTSTGNHRISFAGLQCTSDLMQHIYLLVWYKVLQKCACFFCFIHKKSVRFLTD